jgi:phosphomannomutase
MNYSTVFNGWLGKIAADFTYEHVQKIATGLAKYYKENSTSGQKLVIGYDTRFFAKEFAEYVACLMAQNGVKVFLANRCAPSSVLVVSALHKKSMGALTLTGDEENAYHLGIRAFNNKGNILTEEHIASFLEQKKSKKEIETSLKKWINKGFVEPFDPTICYIQHIEQTIDFSSMVSTNRVLFNPMFGSSIHYFDHLLHEKGLRGYTIDREGTENFQGIEPSPSLHTKQLYEDMVFHGSDLGFIVSPDCSTFEFLIEPHQLTTKEKMAFLLEHFSEKGKKGKVLLSDSLKISGNHLVKTGFTIEYADDASFQTFLAKKEHILAVDSVGRFYFEHHGAPDALLCGYYLLEILNNKELTPKTLHQKLNRIKGVH